MKKAFYQLIIILICLFTNVLFADNADYSTLRKFLSARMYGEAYNELLRQELSGNGLDAKLKSLKKDLLDRTNDKLQKQVKTNSKDSGIFIILADIAFQKGDYDRATQYISNALSNNGNAMGHYIFSKILFRKGNIDQAFDQMGRVLEAMPDSPIVFNDFQFLYTCKQYGVATAKKLTKDTSFLARSTPIAYDENDELDVPVSPFENDPTETVESPDFSNYNRERIAKVKDTVSDYEDNGFDDISELSEMDITPVTTPKYVSKSEKDNKSIDNSNLEKKKDDNLSINAKIKNQEIKETPLPDEIEDFDEFGAELDNDDFSIASNDIKNTSGNDIIINDIEPDSENSDSDPEIDKLQEVEKLFLAASNKYKLGYVEEAVANLEAIQKIYPNWEGKKELENKIIKEKTIRKEYKRALERYENSSNDDYVEYDELLLAFKKAYDYNPKEYKEAPFYIGRCYILKNEPDFENAIKYFDLIVDDPDLNKEIKRSILWTKLEVYYDDERYDEADEIFSTLLNDDEKFVKEQEDYKRFRYGLWYNLYKVWIVAGFSFVISFVLVIFILQFLPDITKLGGDPLSNSKKALDSGNFEKAIKIAEKGLTKNPPIQIDRQLREILTESYYDVGNYEKCRYHADAILQGFPDNVIALGFFYKASMQINDTSSKAIKLYEETYRNDPSKKEVLPILAHHYAVTGNISSEAVEMMQDYYRDNPEDNDVVIGLAEAYVKNRTMVENIVPVLNDALKIKDKIEYRELLARTFSRCELYNEAARECVNVLNKDINNIGIHVVYTTSMKKLNLVNAAIEQYKLFIDDNPGNSQLIEILNGLKKEAVDTSTLVDDVPKLSDMLGMPGMSEADEFAGMSIPDLPEPGDDYPESNTSILPDSNMNDLPEPGMGDLPETVVSDTNEYEKSNSSNNDVSFDLPDFISQEKEKVSEPNLLDNNEPNKTENESTAAGLIELPDDIATLDPFADNDSLFEGFETDELPEELGGTSRESNGETNSLDNLIDNFNLESENTTNNDSNNDFGMEPMAIRNSVPEPSQKTGVLALAEKLESAKDLAARKEWDGVVDLLVPEFASNRNKEIGFLLIDAWLGKGKPETALEIIQTLDFDPEMMPENVKNILYRTAVALEMSKKYSDALRLYDSICNADINYLDAFDRADKLYVKMKSKA